MAVEADFHTRRAYRRGPADPGGAPDVQRGRQHRPDPGSARATRARRRHPGRRRRQPGRHGRPGPLGHAPHARAASARAHAPKTGSARPTAPASPGAWTQDYDVLVEMDADGSHRPEDLPRLLDGHRQRRRSRHRFALRLRWRDPELEAVAPGAVPGRQRVRVDDARPRRARRHRRFPRLPRRRCCSASTSPTCGPTATASRSKARGSRFAPAPAWSKCRSDSRTVTHGESKMSKTIVVEALRLVTKWGVTERTRNAQARRRASVPPAKLVPCGPGG